MHAHMCIRLLRMQSLSAKCCFGTHYTYLFNQLGTLEHLYLIINISKVYLIECIMIAAAVCSSASIFPSFIIINNVD